MPPPLIIDGLFPEAETLYLQLLWFFRASGTVPAAPREACADAVFDPLAIHLTLRDLRRWAQSNLGAAHATTPHLHLCAPGRTVALPGAVIASGWRYLISLHRAGAGDRNAPGVRVGAASRGRWLAINRTQVVRMDFNRLLVTRVEDDVAVTAGCGRTAPGPPATLLYGYLW